jgi:5-deoxy-D-glucuronate isomerase
LQEVYFLKVQPKPGFGLMRLYDYEGLDETYAVRNNDVVWIPRGIIRFRRYPGTGSIIVGRWRETAAN